MTIPRALLLVIFAGAATAFAEWRVSLPGWNYEFPRDHGAHTDFKTEWWYFTGNLTAETGERFGYQLTFFRRALQPVVDRADRDVGAAAARRGETQKLPASKKP